MLTFIYYQDWREDGNECFFLVDPDLIDLNERQNDKTDNFDTFHTLDKYDVRQNDDLLRTAYDNIESNSDFHDKHDKLTRLFDKHDFTDTVTIDIDFDNRRETNNTQKTDDKTSPDIDIKVQRQSVTNPLHGGKLIILILVFTHLIDSVNGRCVM